jgi:hypothetical protein
MRELYIEGLATHDDPKSCAGSREGAGEALTGARTGRAIEPRDLQLRGADVLGLYGRQHRRGRHRKPPGDPARSKNPSMCGISTRENREIPGSPIRGISGWAAQRRLRPQA